MRARNAVWLVARRELVERTRQRALRISTIVQVLLVAGAIVAASLTSDGPTTHEIGLVGARSDAVASDLSVAARRAGDRVRLTRPSSRAAATRALREDGLDAALLDGSEVLVLGDRDSEAAWIIRAALATESVRLSLSDQGLTRDEVRKALEPPAVSIQALDPKKAVDEEDAAIVFAGLFLLYLALLTFGSYVTYGVVEEKASRVVELLLVAVRPVHLLAGKVIGIGLVGLGQIVLVGAGACLAALVVGSSALPAAGVQAFALILLWFVLGYALYAGAFAVAGSLVSRQEDAQSTVAPLIMVIIASYFPALNAVDEPDSKLTIVASFIPPLAPLTAPARFVLGDMQAWELALSVGLTLLATYGLLHLAARIYARGVLRTGAPVKLRDVLRGRLAEAGTAG